MVNETSVSSNGKYGRLRLAGLVIGLVSAGWLLLDGIMSLVMACWSNSLAYSIAFIQIPLTGLVVFFVVAVAWRKPLIGGVALIVVWLIRTLYSVLSSLDGIQRIFEHGLWLTWVVPTILSLLIPVSGILFLISGRGDRAMAEEIVPVATASSRRYKRLLLAGLVVGLVAGTMYIQNVLPTIYYLVFLGVGLVIFGSVALAWKRPLAGGILLIIEGFWPMALLAVSSLLPSSEALGIAMMFSVMLILAPFYCLPLLASGILLILSWKQRQLAGRPPS